jgi:hypothetical protein
MEIGLKGRKLHHFAPQPTCSGSTSNLIAAMSEHFGATFCRVFEPLAKPG